MTDDESLADMAPALALMRIDPLTVVTFYGATASTDFETYPGIWRRRAMDSHRREANYAGAVGVALAPASPMR